MARTWDTKEWKEKAKKFVEGKKCEWCGTTENLVPAHRKKRGGYTREEYLDLEKNCGVKCSKCNFAESKGLRLCPKCGEHYYKPRRNREPMCWECFIKTPHGKEVKAFIEAHPELYTKSGRRKRRKRKYRK